MTPPYTTPDKLVGIGQEEGVEDQGASSLRADRVTDAPHGAPTGLRPDGSVPTSAGHTPGPWAAYRNKAGGYHIDTALGVESTNNYVIADSILGASEEANARLIAAAPELLEALNYYADQLCEGWCEESPDCAHFEDCSGCLARRVAFKATSTDIGRPVPDHASGPA